MPATPTSSSSTPAACASAPRTSCIRGSASCACSAPSTATIRSWPSPAAWRSRKARRCSSARPASPTSSSARRRSGGCRCWSDAGGAAARRPLIDLNPYEDVSFPLGVTRRDDPVKAYVTIIEGCNEFCSFCVVPYTRGHERMRPKADILAEVREAADSGHREVQLLGQIVNHYEAPDDPACDFTGLLEAHSRGAGHRAHPLRQPASAARLAALPRRDGATARRSAGTCTCRCNRGRRACSRRCAGATRARAISNWSRRSASRCRTWRCRPI